MVRKWAGPSWPRRERVVTCRDVAGRTARVVVRPDGGGPGVLLSAPGGAALRLTGYQAWRLGRALRWAERHDGTGHPAHEPDQHGRDRGPDGW